MQFTPANVEKIRTHKKTETRRPARGEFHSTSEEIRSAAGRLKWRCNKLYALQPGRGKKAVGIIRLRAIRLEHLQEITEAGIKAEGFASREEFIEVWRSLYPAEHKDTRAFAWENNPLVWVLRIEYIQVRGDVAPAYLARTNNHVQVIS